MLCFQMGFEQKDFTHSFIYLTNKLSGSYSGYMAMNQDWQIFYIPVEETEKFQKYTNKQDNFRQ